MDKEVIRDILDTFIDDKFTESEEKLKEAFRNERDQKIYDKLGLKLSEDQLDEAIKIVC